MIAPEQRPQLSVAVCTRDRAASLVQTLERLVTAAARADARWEFLVVDNGSQDHTAEVARSFESRLPRFRVLSAPDPGLSRARNCALAAFRGTWIVFTDDDAWVEADWLQRIECAIRDHPEMDFLGGRSLARWPSPPPPWLRHQDTPFVRGLIGHYDRGDADLEYAAGDELPFGVNMAFSRRLVDALGPFRTDLGAGTPARGEDSDYSRRALRAGLRGRYLADAVVHHAANPQALTLPALYRHGIAKGHTHARMDDPFPDDTSRLREALILARAALQGLRGRGENLRVGVINAGILRGFREARDRAP